MMSGFPNKYCMKKYILSENQFLLFKQFLIEDAESDSQKKAIEYLMNKEGISKEEANKYVRKTFREKFSILNNNRKVGKFTFGALRLYLEDCNTDKDVRNIYLLLKTMGENEDLAKKYDRNFNGKSLNTLVNELDIKENGEEKNKNSKKVYKNEKYEVVRIDNFDESKIYSPYTSWCITTSEKMLSSYTNGYTGQFYFALKQGYKSMSRHDHEDEPLLGEYGLSMLAICVDTDGSLKSCTCRWNHHKDGDDYCLNAKEIEDVTGFNFKNTFLPNKNAKIHEEALHFFEKALYEMSTKDFINFIDNEDNYSFFDIRREQYPNGVIVINMDKKYSYALKNDKVIAKVNAKNCRNNENLVIYENKILFKDFKSDIYKIYDIKDETYKSLGADDISLIKVYIDGENVYYLSMKKDDDLILYTNDMKKVINLKSVYEDVDISKWSIESLMVNTEDASPFVLFINDDSELKKLRFVYSLKNNKVYKNSILMDCYKDKFAVISVNSDFDNLTVFIDDEIYENIETLGNYIYLQNSDTPDRAKYLVMYRGDEILLYNMVDKKFIGQFNSFEYETKVGVVFIAFTNNKPKYDFAEIYIQDDNDYCVLKNHIENITLDSDYNKNKYYMPFKFKDEDGNLKIVAMDGSICDSEKEAQSKCY